MEEGLLMFAMIRWVTGMEAGAVAPAFEKGKVSVASTMAKSTMLGPRER